MAASLPPVIAVLLADTADFTAKMGAAGAEMEALSKKGSGAFTQLASIGKAALLGLATAAVGVGVVSTKLAVDFQAAMERIHTQAQVPQSAIAGLSNQVLDLSGQVGVSAKTLADGLYHVESAFQSTGITGSQAMAILKVAAEGAQVGGANLVDVTNALDAVIVAGIPGVKDYSQAMGVLNATVGSGDMTMQDLAEALGTGVTPVVKNYGLTLQDVGASLATFGDNNIRGADAGTKLRMAVQALAVPMKGGADVLDRMGMSFNQMSQDMARGGIVAALQDLHDHMVKAGHAGVAATQDVATGLAQDEFAANSTGDILTQIFGKRAGTGVAILYDQLDRLKSKYGDITNAAKSFGDAWAETQRTGKVQWEMFAQSAEALAIRIGEWLIPKLIDLKNIIGDVVGWFERHRSIALTLAAAIAGPLAVAIGAFIVSLFTAGGALAFITGPVGLVMAAVAALAGGVVYAYTHWQWFRDTVQSIWDWIVTTLWPGLKNFAGFVGQVFNDPLKAAANAWTGLQNTVHDVAGFVSRTWDSLFGGGGKTATATATINEVGRGVAHTDTTPAPLGPPSPVAQALAGIPPGVNIPTLPGEVSGAAPPGANWSPATVTSRVTSPGSYSAADVTNKTPATAPDPGFIQRNWDAIYKVIQHSISQIGDLVSHESDQISQWWNQHMQSIDTVSAGVWKALVTTAQNLLPVLVDVVRLSFDSLAGTIETTMAPIVGMWSQLWRGLGDIAGTAWHLIAGAVQIGIDIILGIIGIALDVLTGKWGQAWNDLKKMLGQIMKDMTTQLSKAGNDFFNAGRDLIQGLINGIGSLAGAVVKSIEKIGRDLLRTFKDIFKIGSPSQVMDDAGRDILQGLINGLQSKVGSVIGFFANLPGQILGAIGDLGGALFGVGKSMMSGLVNGIGSMVGSAVSAARNAVESAAGVVNAGVGEAPFMGAGGGGEIVHSATGNRFLAKALTWVAEDEPETVVPDSKKLAWSAAQLAAASASAQPLPLAGGGGWGPSPSGGSGGGSLTINVTTTLDGQVVARQTFPYTWAQLLRYARTTNVLSALAAGH